MDDVCLRSMELGYLVGVEVVVKPLGGGQLPEGT
jgi:hypothetical protein